jgi:hypothetical protein
MRASVGSLVDRQRGKLRFTIGNEGGNTFRVGLETYEITFEAIDHVSNILACKGDIGHVVGNTRRGRSEDRVGEREERVVSANVMRSGYTRVWFMKPPELIW